MTLEKQCSPVVRYWRKIFRRAEMEMKIRERYAISAKIEIQMEKKEVLRHFLENGVQMEIGVEDYIRDEVLRIVFRSGVTLDFGEANRSRYGYLRRKKCT